MHVMEFHSLEVTITRRNRPLGSFLVRGVKYVRQKHNNSTIDENLGSSDQLKPIFYEVSGSLRFWLVHLKQHFERYVG